MINGLSRYAVSSEIGADGKIIATRKDSDPVRVSRYLVTSGDTIENMAFKLFGDASQWWRIADVNPQIAFPLDLVPTFLMKEYFLTYLSTVGT